MHYRLALTRPQPAAWMGGKGWGQASLFAVAKTPHPWEMSGRGRVPRVRLPSQQYAQAEKAVKLA